MPALHRRLLRHEPSLPPRTAVGPLTVFPERVLQFGEGNFLRAFVDWMINALNGRGLFNGSVVVVQPIDHGLAAMLNRQDGLYTLLLRGMREGEPVEQRELITAISRAIDPYADWDAFLQCAANPDLRVIVSNTTEAGIAYQEEPYPVERCPQSFPAKVAAVLYARYRHFAGAAEAGLLVLPCELIDRNGETLRTIVLQYARAWGLPADFLTWVETHNVFFNTLVDRIVPGYPRDEAAQWAAELGYDDALLDAAELFHLWVIEGDPRYRQELPFTDAGLNVVWTHDLAPYRTRKVRMLNGAHTMTVLAAYLLGLETVGECMADPLVHAYLRHGLFTEILPTLHEADSEKRAYGDAVLERFRNPFIKHRLLDIALNSVAKFRVRVLPSLLAYQEQTGVLPRILCFALAALLAFYRGSEMRDHALLGDRAGQPYPIRDDAAVLDVFRAHWGAVRGTEGLATLCRAVLARTDFWGQDLTVLPGLVDQVAADLTAILTRGMRDAMADVVASGQGEVVR